MKRVQTADAPEAIGPYSQAMVHNGLVYTSGQIALTPSGEFIGGDIEAQTKQVLANLKAVLKAAGTSPQKVIKTTVYLADMGDFLKMNRIYEAFFAPHKPARSTVAVKTLPKEALVEIECVAVLEEGYTF